MRDERIVHVFSEQLCDVTAVCKDIEQLCCVDLAEKFRERRLIGVSVDRLVLTRRAVLFVGNAEQIPELHVGEQALKLQLNDLRERFVPKRLLGRVAEQIRGQKGIKKLNPRAVKDQLNSPIRKKVGQCKRAHL